MNALSSHAVTIFVYGLSFFVLGVAVAARSCATPASVLRLRFLALAGFGLIHGVFEWLGLLASIDPNAVGPRTSLTVAMASFLLLYAFAFPERACRRRILTVIVGGFVVAWGIAVASIADPVVLQTVMRLGVALPASLAAASTFLRDTSLRLPGAPRGVALTVGGACFLLYAGLHLVFPESDLLPDSVLNATRFEAAFGLSLYAARTIVVVILTVVVLGLLNRFARVLWRSIRAETGALGFELMAREADLQNAQRIGKMGSWVWNIVTNDLAWSDQIFRIFGLAPQEFGASYPAFLKCVHPDDRAFVEEKVRLAVEEHAPYDIEHRIVLPNGEVRHVNEQGEVEFDPTGRPLKMTGTVRDITEEKARQAALEESRGMLSGILTVAEEAVILADNDLRITLFSRGAQRIFGFSEEEAAGMHIERLIPERVRRVHRNHTQSFTDGLETSLQMAARQEVIGLRSNGEEFPAAVALSKYPTATGYIYAIILRDVGPEKTAHEELSAAKLGAESANRMKSTFLANMSHELRTPLNAIIGFSETIQRQTFGPVGSPKYVEYVDDINEAGWHLLNIVNDILDLSKVEAGKAELHEKRLDVAEIVRASMALVSDRARDAGVTLRQDISDAVAPLYADEKMLKQILLNLLTNAVKFNSAGGKVEVKAWSRPDAGVVIQVIDTGIGIALEDIPVALSPFKQVDSSLNRKYEGTGLGLPLSKSLVELHGGSLDLQSEVGVGTTVTVRFPAERIFLEAARA